MLRWRRRERVANTQSLRVEFYTRVGCHLCELAEPVIQRTARRYGALVRKIDVDTRPELQARFGMKIPLVRINDGNQVALRITEARLVRAFERARQRASNPQ